MPALGRPVATNNDCWSRSNLSFFESPQGAARLKLGILGRYVAQFTSKVGSRSAGNRVCYFDGYAGQGFYDDGEAGSPVVAAQAAELFQNKFRDLDGFLVEKDRETFEALVDSFPLSTTWQLRHGTANEYVDEMLEWAGSSPLLAFIDPFGLGVSYSDLKRIMSRPGKTEILLNVSKPGVRRNAGHLTSEKDYKARQAFVDKVDRCLGGDWWQAIWEEAPGDEAARKICIEFCSRVSDDLKCGYFVVPVRDRLDGPIDYYLLLLTRHQDGHWHFNESVSNTMQEQIKVHCEETGEIPFDETDTYVTHIEENILRILDDGDQSLPLNRSMSSVYGTALGRARQTHVRKALVRLQKAGHIAEVPNSRQLPKFRPKRPSA